jgi:uncharacterized membrane protein YhhN
MSASPIPRRVEAASLAALIVLGAATLYLYESAPSSLYAAAPRVACSLALITLGTARALAQPDRYARRIVLALVLAGAADSFLAMSPAWPPGFLVAMGVFLTSHVVFIVAFGPAPDRVRSALTLLPIAAYALLVVSVLYPFLGALRVPVLFYVAGLAAMAWRACLLAQDRSLPVGQRIALGAGGILFLAADTVLAIHKFHGAIAHQKVLAMTPYWGSLACFGLSIRKAAIGHPATGPRTEPRGA